MNSSCRGGACPRPRWLPRELAELVLRKLPRPRRPAIAQGRGHRLVAVAAAGEVLAHRGARGVGLALGDARDDQAVLLLDRRQVRLLVGGTALLALHGPARDDVVAEE